MSESDESDDKKRSSAEAIAGIVVDPDEFADEDPESEHIEEGLTLDDNTFRGCLILDATSHDGGLSGSGLMRMTGCVLRGAALTGASTLVFDGGGSDREVAG